MPVLYIAGMIRPMKTSLEHLPENKQAKIQFLLDTIRDEFEQVRGFATSEKRKLSRISMVILFGSYAKGSYVDDPVNGYFSDYDVLVVLNRSELVDEYTIWHTAEERISQQIKAPVNILVHTHTEVNNWLQQGHYFFSDIRKEGIGLYAYNGASLIEPGELKPEELQLIAQQHYDQWFDSAKSFLKQFMYAMKDGEMKIASFLLHQTAERFLSCILLVFTNYRPQTHNIKALYNFAAQHAEELKKVFPQDSKFNRRCFELLKRAYVESRYSEHYSITEEELRWLAERVDGLQILTEKLCKEKIQGYNE